MNVSGQEVNQKADVSGQCKSEKKTSTYKILRNITLDIYAEKLMFLRLFNYSLSIKLQQLTFPT